MTSVYKLKSKILVYPEMSGWRFLVLPKEVSVKIKEQFGSNARGWGSLPVEVTIGKTIWQTSIFPDKKSGTYLLPLKAQVRKKEEIYDDDEVKFQFKLN
ncbi:hypothetical protein CL653_02430 [bacterium]|nr:hypothetical protein [bacterium]